MDAITVVTTPAEHGSIKKFFGAGRNNGLAWLLSELSRDDSDAAMLGDSLYFGRRSLANSDEAWTFCAAIDTATLAMAFGASAEAIDRRPRLFAETVLQYAEAVGRPVKAGRISAVLRDERWESAGGWISSVAVERLREALRATAVWAVMQELHRRTGHPLPALHIFACRLRGPDF